MGEVEQAEQDPQQRRLPRPVGAEDRDELALGHEQIHAAPHGGAPEAHRRVAQLDRRGHYLPVASCRARGESFELRDLPLLEAVARRRERLGDGRDRDVRGARKFVDPLHIGGHVLAVEHPHLDLAIFGLAIHSALVLGGHFAALGDRLGEAVGRQQLQVKVFAETLEDALAVAHRHPGVARADLTAQRVVARQSAGLEGLLAPGEVGRAGRVQAIVVGDDPVHDRVHVGREVPAVGVLAVVQPE